MMLTRKNPKGGRTLSTFPIVEEPRSGNIGYKLGYCDGCGEPMVCRMSEAREIAEHFVGGLNAYHEIVKTVSKVQVVKVPLKVKLAQWLLKKTEFKDDLALGVNKS